MKLISSYNKSKGFTLLEVIMASSIMTIALTCIMMVLNSVQDAKISTVAQINVASQIERTLEKIAEDLRYAQIQGVVNDADITFMIPIDFDGDNDVIDAVGNIEWGAFAPATSSEQLNWSKRYSFVQNSTISEAGTGVDYNNDGDKLDNFALGHIKFDVLDTASVVQYSQDLTTNCIFSTSPNFGDDMDGDGFRDPLFERVDSTGAQNVAGKSIRVRIWSMVDSTGKPGDVVVRDILDSTINLVNE